MSARSAGSRTIAGAVTGILAACVLCGCDTGRAGDTADTGKAGVAAKPGGKNDVASSEPAGIKNKHSGVAQTEEIPTGTAGQRFLGDEQAGGVAASTPAAQRNDGAAKQGSGRLYVSPRRRIDERTAASAGIRKIGGEHLTLYTDLPKAEEIERLPALFEQAIPQWCAYFEVPPAQISEWKLNGFLIKDKAPFAETGLLPGDLPEFRNGFARGSELWLYEQPTDYYRRHLFLHEGTHAFMYAALGSCGPPWYMEGTAELLATHAFPDGKLRLRYFPQHRKEVPMLGRIKLVQDRVESTGVPLPVSSILSYSNRAHLANEPYAWCWALSSFLDGHPRYGDRFRKLQEIVTQPDFNRRFLESYQADWQQLRDGWQVFAATLEHGHDIKRNAIRFAESTPLAEGSHEVGIRADAGWQDSGIELQAGRTYRIIASGRYRIGAEPKIWWCEPQGVTIRYYRGHPLGKLLAVLRPTESETTGRSPFLAPLGIGREHVLTPKRSGELFLRINDPPNELADNAGELQVSVTVEE